MILQTTRQDKPSFVTSSAELCTPRTGQRACLHSEARLYVCMRLYKRRSSAKGVQPDNRRVSSANHAAIVTPLAPASAWIRQTSTPARVKSSRCMYFDDQRCQSRYPWCRHSLRSAKALSQCEHRASKEMRFTVSNGTSDVERKHVDGNASNIPEQASAKE